MCKVLAVGDIHTKMWIIESVTKLINQYDCIVFIGDYADDWDQSPLKTIETWRRLKMLTSLYPDKVRALVGNHDFAYLLSFDPRSGGYNRTTQLLLDSPENRDLKTWLSKLPVTAEIDGVTYSHAGIDATWNESVNEHSLWADNSPIWTRPDDSDYIEVPQVFGHTPHATCTQLENNIWCIDTFSSYRDGTPIGDQTVLEITDGETFNIKKLENNDNNSNTPSVSNEVSEPRSRFNKSTDT